jgi:hypothetical protein
MDPMLFYIMDPIKEIMCILATPRTLSSIEQKQKRRKRKRKIETRQSKWNKILLSELPFELLRKIVPFISKRVHERISLYRMYERISERGRQNAMKERIRLRKLNITVPIQEKSFIKVLPFKSSKNNAKNIKTKRFGNERIERIDNYSDEINCRIKEKRFNSKIKTNNITNHKNKKTRNHQKYYTIDETDESEDDYYDDDDDNDTYYQSCNRSCCMDWNYYDHWYNDWD